MKDGEDDLEFPIRIAIPITEAELFSLIDRSFEYNPPSGSDHSKKPAFLRMLILFPDFTKNLVLEMSQNENRNRMDDFQEDIFVAHQLMARLVDRSDPGVVRNNDVNKSYLGV